MLVVVEQVTQSIVATSSSTVSTTSSTPLRVHPLAQAGCTARDQAILLIDFTIDIDVQEIFEMQTKCAFFRRC